MFISPFSLYSVILFLIYDDCSLPMPRLHFTHELGLFILQNQTAVFIRPFLNDYILSKPSYIAAIGRIEAMTNEPTTTAINTMINGSIAARMVWVVISTSSS